MSGRLYSIQAQFREAGYFLQLYKWSIVVMLVGLLYSRAMLSIGQITLVSCFLLEGDWLRKWKEFTGNRYALLFSGLFLIHLLGLFYTDNFEYAVKDLRIKIPLLFFPIIFSSARFVDKKFVDRINYLFLGLVFSRTLAILFYYWWNADSISDLREAFFHISHIRFSLMVMLSMALILYYMRTANRRWFYAGIILCLYFLAFFLFFELITGLVLSLFILPLSLFLLSGGSYPNSRAFRLGAWPLSLLFTAILIYVSFMAIRFSNLQSIKEVEKLDRTANGHSYAQPYDWNKDFLIRENGYRVHQNVCYEEVESEWNRRSEQTIIYFDETILPTEEIILRYLASKGLPKDSASVASLSKEEINGIEQGITNVEHLGKPGFEVRIKEIIWEFHNYKNGGVINGHSLAMRLEFWKTGWHAWNQHFLIGVGTGDVEEKMQEQYELDGSRLSSDWRFRSHNQFISIGLALGLIGFLYLIASLIFPFYPKRFDYFYICFLVISIISMISEDTLDTQIGIGYFAFFNAFYFFRKE